MPQRILTAVGISLCVSLAGQASAQVFVRQASMTMVTRASANTARVSGTVHDTTGEALGGVSVIAVGATLVGAKSDRLGRFLLALPPGEYVLRATRDGYVSTYREPIRVRSSAHLERDITLVRQNTQIPPTAASGDLEALADPNHSHTEIAWRLRHLKRSVLRDGSASAVGPEGDTDRFQPRSAFLLATGLEGQVNLLTSGSLDAAGDWSTRRWSGQLAYLALGAPVGSHGKWKVNAGMTSGEPWSWAVLGEYHANEDQAHAFTAGMSYATRRAGSADTLFHSAIAADSWTVGSLYAADQWLIVPGVAVDYGLRFDRYDYLGTPELFSPEVGVRVAAPAQTWVTARVAQHMVAPGADEFRPPVSEGLWMPSERTFSAFEVGARLDAERVRDVEVGIGRDLGPPESGRTVSVRYFHQSVTGQTTTLFGLARTDANHYLLARSGDVEVDGFVVGVAGALLPNVRGTVDYSVGEAEWFGPGPGHPVAVAAPSARRLGVERLHDLAASLDAEIPRTATNLTMAYRMSSGFSRAGEVAGLAGRFAVEVRQALPYQPIRGGRLDIVVGVRNLFRDFHEVSSVYDELLTVEPPTRFVGGFQVRF
jgi:hypothetical protein